MPDDKESMRARAVQQTPVRHRPVRRKEHAARRIRAARRNADIQDEIRRRKIEAIRTLRGADIQDVMRRQIDGVLDLMAYPGSADIQDAIDAGRPWPVRLSP